MPRGIPNKKTTAKKAVSVRDKVTLAMLSKQVERLTNVVQGITEEGINNAKKSSSYNSGSADIDDMFNGLDECELPASTMAFIEDLRYDHDHRGLSAAQTAALARNYNKFVHGVRFRT